MRCGFTPIGGGITYQISLVIQIKNSNMSHDGWSFDF